MSRLSSVDLRRKVYSRIRSMIPVERVKVYSIGMLEGKSPLDLHPRQRGSVLSAKHVTDVKAKYVADPFWIRDCGKFYMFFEVWNLSSDKGEIGLAMSDNGLHWHYCRIVLREPFHLSYPYVFRWENAYYMIPESGAANSVRLYKANPFPSTWSYVATLLDHPYVDTSVYYCSGRWWLFAATKSELYLYHASELAGPWTKHPKNPIVTTAHASRPAGRIFAHGDRVFRVAQDCESHYGLNVRIFEISILNEADYEETEICESPLLEGSGFGWNGRGMHHMDAQPLENGTWLASVDGWTLVPAIKGRPRCSIPERASMSGARE